MRELHSFLSLNKILDVDCGSKLFEVWKFYLVTVAKFELHLWFEHMHRIVSDIDISSVSIFFN